MSTVLAGTLYFGLDGDTAGLVAGVLVAIAACLISAILVPVIPRSLTIGGDR